MPGGGATDPLGILAASLHLPFPDLLQLQGSVFFLAWLSFRVLWSGRSHSASVFLVCDGNKSHRWPLTVVFGNTLLHIIFSASVLCGLFPSRLFPIVADTLRPLGFFLRFYLFILGLALEHYTR